MTQGGADAGQRARPSYNVRRSRLRRAFAGRKPESEHVQSYEPRNCIVMEGQRSVLPSIDNVMHVTFSAFSANILANKRRGGDGR